MSVTGSQDIGRKNFQTAPHERVGGVQSPVGVVSIRYQALRRAELEIAMMRLDQVMHRDPDILAGTPVFHGTRVPIRSLFDYVEGGDTLDEFLRQFPSVRREQAIALLDLARDAVADDAPTA